MVGLSCSEFSATFVQDNHLWGALRRREGVKDLHAHMLLLLVCTTIPRLGKVYIEVESENQR